MRYFPYVKASSLAITSETSFQLLVEGKVFSWKKKKQTRRSGKNYRRCGQQHFVFEDHDLNEINRLSWCTGKQIDILYILHIYILFSAADRCASTYYRLMDANRNNWAGCGVIEHFCYLPNSFLSVSVRIMPQQVYHFACRVWRREN